MGSHSGQSLEPGRWIIERLRNAVESGDANQIREPICTFLSDLFDKDHYWMVEPRIELVEPRTEPDEFEDAFNVNTRSVRLDYAVTKATEGLSADIRHVYIHVTSGSIDSAEFKRQLQYAFSLIVGSIPVAMAGDVLFFLINGRNTLFWRFNRATTITNNTFNTHVSMDTFGEEMMELLREVAGRD